MRVQNVDLATAQKAGGFLHGRGEAVRLLRNDLQLDTTLAQLMRQSAVVQQDDAEVNVTANVQASQQACYLYLGPCPAVAGSNVADE